MKLFGQKRINVVLSFIFVCYCPPDASSSIAFIACLPLTRTTSVAASSPTGSVSPPSACASATASPSSWWPIWPEIRANQILVRRRRAGPLRLHKARPADWRTIACLRRPGCLWTRSWAYLPFSPTRAKLPLWRSCIRAGQLRKTTWQPAGLPPKPLAAALTRRPLSR